MEEKKNIKYFFKNFGDRLVLVAVGIDDGKKIVCDTGARLSSNNTTAVKMSSVYAAVLKSSSDEFWNKFKSEAEKKAKAHNVAVDIFFSKDEDEQKNILEFCRTAGYKAVAVAPFSLDVLSNFTRDAKEDCVSVISIFKQMDAAIFETSDGHDYYFLISLCETDDIKNDETFSPGCLAEKVIDEMIKELKDGENT